MRVKIIKTLALTFFVLGVFDVYMLLQPLFECCFAYADLILNGDPELYLKTVTE